MIKKNLSPEEKQRYLNYLRNEINRCENESPEQEVIQSSEQSLSTVLGLGENLLKRLQSDPTGEALDDLKVQADIFNKLSTNMLKSVADNYTREKGHALREKELAVKQFHEINESMKIAQANPALGVALLSNISQLLGLPANVINSSPVIEQSSNVETPRIEMGVTTTEEE